MKKLKLKGTYASINLDNIAHNYKEVCKLVDESVEISCVLKSDAYGHGEKQVIETLVENGLSTICVGTITEAIRLRKEFAEIDILILGYTPKFMALKVAEYNLIQTISSKEEAITFNESGIIKVHIKVNTGMNRLGFSADSADDIVEVSKLKNIRICGIFTHLHSSDSGAAEPTLMQFEKFERLLNNLESKGVQTGLRHVCNSGGIIDFCQMHMDMVRAGIMIYGLYPSDKIKHKEANLKECMELHSYISGIIDIKKGEGISYGHTFIAQEDMTIAAVNLGYSDGVFRNLSNRGEVIIHNERRPIVGTICMNMFMVDITGMEKVIVEDEVIMFGQSGNQVISINDVAEWAGTISYEVTCRTGYSVPRVYIKNHRIIECEQEFLIESGKNIKIEK